jgi:hypothetical protein
MKPYRVRISVPLRKPISMPGLMDRLAPKRSSRRQNSLCDGGNPAGVVDDDPTIIEPAPPL